MVRVPSSAPSTGGTLRGAAGPNGCRSAAGGGLAVIPTGWLSRLLRPRPRRRRPVGSAVVFERDPPLIDNLRTNTCELNRKGAVNSAAHTIPGLRMRASCRALWRSGAAAAVDQIEPGRGSLRWTHGETRQGDRDHRKGSADPPRARAALPVGRARVLVPAGWACRVR